MGQVADLGGQAVASGFRAFVCHELAKEVSQDLFKECAVSVANGDVNKGALAFARSSASRNGVCNTVALARSEPGIGIGIDAMDSDPWLLNVENGDYRLTNRQSCVNIARVTSSPRLLPSPSILSLIARTGENSWITIFGRDVELIEYVRRLIGYTLTGPAPNSFSILVRHRSQRKSTFCELLMRLLGDDYSMKAAPDLLMMKNSESHPTDRADLFGKRFVACIETEEGKRLAESLVKECLRRSR